MKLNNLDLVGYRVLNDAIRFVLNCDITDAVALKDQDFTITQDDDQIAFYNGYNISRIERDSSTTEVRTIVYVDRKIDDSTEAVISGLEKSVATIVTSVDKNTTLGNDLALSVAELGKTLEDQNTETNLAIAELGKTVEDKNTETALAVAELGKTVEDQNNDISATIAEISAKASSLEELSLETMQAIAELGTMVASAQSTTADPSTQSGQEE